MAPQERSETATMESPEPISSETTTQDEKVVAPTTSNEYVLNVAFFSFVGFMAVQAIFAVIAHSEAMLADCEAMSVDAITYLFNLCAERIKNRPYSESELALSQEVRNYRRELQRLYLEIIPPTISITALITVTIYTIQDSLRTIYGEDDGDGDDVSVPIMLIFSGANLLLDFVNIFCFSRANMSFGLDVMKKEHLAIKDGFGGRDINSALKTDGDNDNEELGLLSAAEVSKESYGATSFFEDAGSQVMVNLNMCSAWTHICADTLRSAAVLIAAGLAMVIPQFDGATTDAVAALLVSVIILVSLMPLVQGLVLTALQIHQHKQNPPSQS